MMAGELRLQLPDAAAVIVYSLLVKACPKAGRIIFGNPEVRYEVQDPCRCFFLCDPKPWARCPNSPRRRTPKRLGEHPHDTQNNQSQSAGHKSYLEIALFLRESRSRRWHASHC